MSERFGLNTKLQLQPLQVIETAGEVILRRGCTRIKVAGKGAAPGVKLLLAAVSEDGATPLEICASFSPSLHSSVQQLIRQLVSSRLLVPANDCELLRDQGESSLDVFYWNFGATASEVARRLKDAHIVIVGVNYISRQLATALAASGFDNYEIVDSVILRNRSLFLDNGTLFNQWPSHLRLPIADDEWLGINVPTQVHCIVACSDFSSTDQLREWNRICIARKWSFFPVVLNGIVGNIGPFVIPGETPCYECLYCRENSNMDDMGLERNIASTSLQGQEVIGLFPSMATVIGDLASFELTKLYSEVLPTQNVGRLVEVNLLASQLTSRKILKIPRCRACSPLKTKASSNSRHAVLAEDCGPQDK